jgi:hypothetical protein
MARSLAIRRGVPHPSVEPRSWAFRRGTLPLAGRLAAEAPAEPFVERYRHRATTGTRGSLSWGAGGSPNGLARDLRPDEAFGPVFTSSRSTNRCRSSASRRSCFTWPCRPRSRPPSCVLPTSHPTARRHQVTAGILNLTHRRSHANPEPLEPGSVEEIRVQLRGMGYRFEAGHRIRVSVASSAWPVVWPSPFLTEFALHGGAAAPSRLILPVVPPGRRSGRSAAAGVQGLATGRPRTSRSADHPTRPAGRILDDVVEGSVTVTFHDGGSDALHDGRRLYAAETIWLTARDADPARALLDADVVYRWWEHDHTIEIRARSTQASTATDFDLSVDLEVDLDGTSFFKRRWEEQIPRDLV